MLLGYLSLSSKAVKDLQVNTLMIAFSLTMLSAVYAAQMGSSFQPYHSAEII
jgi:hypothetical protein